jgi:hypothetical protein
MSYTIHQARTNRSRLIKEAESGGESHHRAGEEIRGENRAN